MWSFIAISSGCELTGVIDPLILCPPPCWCLWSLRIQLICHFQTKLPLWMVHKYPLPFRPPASTTSGYFWHHALWISQFCITHFPLSVRPLHTHTHQGVDMISEIKIHRTWLTKHNVVSSATVQPTGERELMYQINLTAPPLCFWRRRSVIDIFCNGSRLLATNLRLLPDAGPWLQIAASRHHTGQRPTKPSANCLLTSVTYRA